MSEIDDKIDSLKDLLQTLEAGVRMSFAMNQEISHYIYFLKSRIKNKSHIIEKIQRKNLNGRNITANNLLEEITDLVGFRVLILFPQHFENIHNFIMSKVKLGVWKLYEKPRAYSWDDDMKDFFRNKLNIEEAEFKESLYTSLHYVLKIDNNDNSPYFEIQVRTLFEEIFGEIDHLINYPQHTENNIMKNQLKTLAKLASAGTKLTENIYLQKTEIEKSFNQK